jgi:hypothetical protein
MFLMSNEARRMLASYGICPSSSISWIEFLMLNVLGSGMVCVMVVDTNFASLLAGAVIQITTGRIGVSGL